MDGDGSIQVNHWKNKILQYRLVIKLKNLNSNYNMLINIAKVIGGSVRIVKKDVLWVINKKEDIIKIIEIFDKYPLLTSRKICQLSFLNFCLYNTSRAFLPPSERLYLFKKPARWRESKNRALENYFNNRDLKYKEQSNIVSQSASSFKKPIYFKEWLSGFIEAEGCFIIRKSKSHSFLIGQNDDKYLIEAIKKYFEATNIVRNPSKNLYSIEIYRKEIIRKIIIHCTNYPLLGEKLDKFKKFSKEFNKE